jgi:endonuclease YncB( thermonuclease family)
MALMTWLRLSASIACLLLSGAAADAPARLQKGEVRYVTDGDTFRLTSGERIRIADIDAPETQVRQAKCRLEIRRGEAASRRARTLLEGKAVTFERVGRSYNRTVARVRLDGRDLGETLVAMGAAKQWLRRQPKPDWCS